MKKKKIKTKGKDKDRKFWSSSERKVLIIIGIALLSVIVSLYIYIGRDKLAKENAHKVFVGKVVPDSMVCMVSGQVKPEAITPVTINKETYWGCCSKCIAKLKKNASNVHYATDPFSKAEVNKSQAYIRLDPKNMKQVKFFESPKSYIDYIELINNK